MFRLHSSPSRGVFAVFSILALMVCLGSVDISTSFAYEPLETEAALDDIFEGGRPGGGDNESGDAEEIIIPNLAPQDPRRLDEIVEQEPNVLEKIHDAFLAVTNWLNVR